MVSKDLEQAFIEMQLETEDIVIETVQMLKGKYDTTMRKVLDVIALWWIHNNIKDLTEAQNHMPELMRELDGVIDPANEQYVEDMTEMFGQVFEFNYDYARGVLGVEEEEKSDPLILFTALGLASLVWASDGLTYQDRMALRKEQLKAEIRMIVLRGSTMGYDTKRIMEMVREEMSKSKYRGVQMMVDEANHYANEAIKQLAQDNFNGYEISEVLDMKTCSHCRDMHGKRYEWSEYEIGLTAPLFHNSCRGRIIPIGKQPQNIKPF